MFKLNSTEARKSLSDLLSRVEYGREPVGIVRRGKVRAVMIPVEAFELFLELLDEADAREAEEAMAEGGVPIPFEEIRRRFGLDEDERVNATAK